MQRFQDRIIEIIDDHPLNLIVALDPIIMEKLIKTECTAHILRQRVFVMWVLVDGLRTDPTLRSSVNKIMEHIGFCCTKVLQQKDEKFLKELAAARLNDKLTVSFLLLIMNESFSNFWCYLEKHFGNDSQIVTY